MNKKFLCTTNRDHYTRPICRWVNMDDQGYVDGKTPVEDLGMYFYCNTECTVDEADQVFRALLIYSEGGVDDNGNPITEKPEDELKSDIARNIYEAIVNPDPTIP